MEGWCEERLAGGDGRRGMGFGGGEVGWFWGHVLDEGSAVSGEGW